MRGKSKKRIEMGEAAWSEWQRQRNLAKVKTHKNKNVTKVVFYRRRCKLALIEYKGGKCERCGFDKPIPSCYDFHHVDPSIKEFTISHSSKSLDVLKKEVDKCQLLCKNCHAEIHDELFLKSIGLSFNG